MTARPRVSVIIPVRNDAAALRRTLDHLTADVATCERAEIIVAAAGDRAGTSAAVAGRAELLWPAGSTRARLMNAGAAIASGDVLFFVHADSWPPRDAVRLILRALDEPRVVGGAFEHRFREPSPSLHAICWMNRVRYRLNHRVPLLWRFHLVHHTDLDLDVTTAFRFHAGEILLSVLFRAGQIIVIGAAPAAVLAYEIALNVFTEFHHSNWRLPLRLERALNLVLVTPRMHGIHHSIVERESSANTSIVFPWWDRLHGTLRLDVPQDAIVIGVPAYRDGDDLGVGRLLVLPFVHRGATWRLPDGRHPDRDVSGDVRRLAA